jgi:hypothetical protein
MTETRLWDRAAVVPIRSSDRRLPEVVALPETLPTAAELFDFMRDAEMRFETLRLRIEERTQTSRGEDVVAMDSVLRHPGEAKVTTTRATDAARPEYEVWISDGEIVRTYASAHGLGTQRPVRNRPRRPGRSGPARHGEGLRAGHRAADGDLPDTFVHPAGYCQNVLATGRCLVSGTDIVSPRGDPARVRPPRTTELPGDVLTSTSRSRSIARRSILRLVESIGGEVTRHAEVIELLPDVPLPAAAFYFVFPTGTTMLY